MVEGDERPLPLSGQRERVRLKLVPLPLSLVKGEGGGEVGAAIPRVSASAPCQEPPGSITWAGGACAANEGSNLRTVRPSYRVAERSKPLRALTFLTERAGGACAAIEGSNISDREGRTTSNLYYREALWLRSGVSLVAVRLSRVQSRGIY